MAENVVLMRLIPALSDPQTGRLDAKRVAQELHLSPDAIACSLERTVAQIYEHSDAPELQPHLYAICRIWSVAIDLYAGEKTSAYIFMNTSNEHLEKRAPIDFIKSGDLVPLESLMEAMNIRQAA